ncbi:MAG: leucine-rich repeat domain-containing protein [Candidatus Ornithomonoglobus sp.]
MVKKSKKLISVLLGIAMTAASVQVFAQSSEAPDNADSALSENGAELRADGSCGNDLTWSLYRDGTLIINGTGEMYDYYNISGSSAPWYRYAEDILSLEIKEGVTSIGSWAFAYCSNLTSIEISKGTASIGNYAFYYCKALVRVGLSDGLETIGDYAFTSCQKLTGIEIPDGVKIISDNAFSSCRSLASIEIPDTVTSIGDWVFMGCSSLASITFLSPYTVIGSRMFPGYGDFFVIYGYDNSTAQTYAEQYGIPFESLGVSSNEPDIIAGGICGDNLTWSLDSSRTLTISGAGDMYDYSGSGAPWYSYKDNIVSLIINDDVTGIGSYAFYNCDCLTSAEIPDGVKSIGDCAFQVCRSLSSIELPVGLTSIGDSAFSSCSSLDSIEIPDGVTSIGDHVFNYCESLSSVELPACLTSIGNSAFASCDRLSCITIPDRVTSIGSYAFSYCSSLSSIELPVWLASIGNSAFQSCIGLSSIELPAGLISIGSDAFYNCSSLESVTFLSPDTAVNDQILRNCSASIIIYGYDDSTAQEYAEEKNITFESLGAAPPKPEITGADAVPDDITGKITVSVTASAVPESARLIAAAYRDGQLSVFSEIENGAAVLDSDGVSEIKIFCWNNLDNMRPLCYAKTAEKHITQ